MLLPDFLAPCACKGIQAILLKDETHGPVTPVIDSYPTTGGVTEAISYKPGPR